MFLQILFLACSLSMDAIGIGITYSIRKMKISATAKIIICLISFLFTLLAVTLGNLIVSLIPPEFAKYLGAFMLFILGAFIILQAFCKKSEKIDAKSEKNIKVYKIMFRSFKVSIEIMKDPSSGDIDKSKSIEPLEAIYLGTALSIDSLGVGISSVVSGVNSFFMPFAVSIFQFVFLTLGVFLGSKISLFKKIDQRVFIVICGVILVFIALIRCF